ncbi:MAG: hypothetical protein PVJ39_14415 [Gammaproteobacteria bacterium]|jgi:hypothetical protein
MTNSIKTVLIAAAVSLLITSAASASEEIQLAEAIGGASTSTAGTDTTAAAQTSQSAIALQTANTIAFGAIAASALAIVAGADSASTH